MMLAPTASPTAQYVAGGIVHLFAGLFYAVLYAMFFASASRAPKGGRLNQAIRGELAGRPPPGRDRAVLGRWFDEAERFVRLEPASFPWRGVPGKFWVPIGAGRAAA